MYKLTPTTQRAMGDAFLLTFADRKQIILAEGGEMQLRKALRENALSPIEYRRINNVDADSQQRNGTATYIIKEELS